MSVAEIDTDGWPFVRRQAWFKDRDYTEVWVSRNGVSWHMLGMEDPLMDPATAATLVVYVAPMAGGDWFWRVGEDKRNGRGWHGQAPTEAEAYAQAANALCNVPAPELRHHEHVTHELPGLDESIVPGRRVGPGETDVEGAAAYRARRAEQRARIAGEGGDPPE